METFIRDVHELKKRKKATNEEIHPMEIAELFCDAYHKDNRGRQPNVWYSMLFKGIETVLKTYRNTKTQRDNLPLKIKMVTNSINRLFFHEPSTDGSCPFIQRTHPPPPLWIIYKQLPPPSTQQM